MTTDWIQKAKDLGFSTDGCTSAPNFNFRSCCDEHDFHYQDLDLTRFKADNKLAKCLWSSGWKGKLLAPIYWTAVRICGAGHYKRKQENAKQELINPMPDRMSTDDPSDFRGV